ncbi:hypothetical protein, partial [uncultured Gammaproteobacteria bacterium]
CHQHHACTHTHTICINITHTHNITLSRPKNLQSDKNKRINNDHPFAILLNALLAYSN